MQEVGTDMNYVSQVFIVEQINYHRKMAEKLESLYHQCWPAANASEQPSQEGESSAMPPPPTDPLNAW